MVFAQWLLRVQAVATEYLLLGLAVLDLGEVAGYRQWLVRAVGPHSSMPRQAACPECLGMLSESAPSGRLSETG